MKNRHGFLKNKELVGKGKIQKKENGGSRKMQISKEKETEF